MARSDLARSQLEAAWRQGISAGTSDSVTAGLALAEAQRNAHDYAGATRTRRELVDVIDAALDAWAPVGGNQQSLRQNLIDARLTALSALCSADAYGEADSALWAIGRLRALAADDLTRQSCDTMEAGIRRRLAEGR